MDEEVKHVGQSNVRKLDGITIDVGGTSVCTGDYHERVIMDDAVEVAVMQM